MKAIEWETAVIELIEYLVLGIVMGGVGGVFGIGGGMIAIPVLGILFGLDQQLAQGTALVMVVPNVVLALHRYNQRNRIQLRHALPLVLMSFCFAGSAPCGQWAWIRAACAWGLSFFCWRWRCSTWCACSWRSPRCRRRCVTPGHGSACWVRRPAPWAGCSGLAGRWWPRRF